MPAWSPAEALIGEGGPSCQPEAGDRGQSSDLVHAALPAVQQQREAQELNEATTTAREGGEQVPDVKVVLEWIVKEGEELNGRVMATCTAVLATPAPDRSSPGQAASSSMMPGGVQPKLRALGRHMRNLLEVTEKSVGRCEDIHVSAHDAPILCMLKGMVPDERRRAREVLCRCGVAMYNSHQAAQGWLGRLREHEGAGDAVRSLLALSLRFRLLAVQCMGLGRPEERAVPYSMDLLRCYAKTGSRMILAQCVDRGLVVLTLQEAMQCVGDPKAFLQALLQAQGGAGRSEASCAATRFLHIYAVQVVGSLNQLQFDQLCSPPGALVAGDGPKGTACTHQDIVGRLKLVLACVKLIREKWVEAISPDAVQRVLESTSEQVCTLVCALSRSQQDAESGRTIVPYAEQLVTMDRMACSLGDTGASTRLRNNLLTLSELCFTESSLFQHGMAALAEYRELPTPPREVPPGVRWTLRFRFLMTLLKQNLMIHRSTLIEAKCGLTPWQRYRETVSGDLEQVVGHVVSMAQALSPPSTTGGSDARIPEHLELIVVDALLDVVDTVLRAFGHHEEVVSAVFGKLSAPFASREPASPIPWAITHAHLLALLRSPAHAQGDDRVGEMEALSARLLSSGELACALRGSRDGPPPPFTPAMHVSEMWTTGSVRLLLSAPGRDVLATGRLSTLLATLAARLWNRALEITACGRLDHARRILLLCRATVKSLQARDGGAPPPRSGDHEPDQHPPLHQVCQSLSQTCYDLGVSKQDQSTVKAHMSKAEAWAREALSALGNERTGGGSSVSGGGALETGVMSSNQHAQALLLSRFLLFKAQVHLWSRAGDGERSTRLAALTLSLESIVQSEAVRTLDLCQCFQVAQERACWRPALALVELLVRREPSPLSAFVFWSTQKVSLTFRLGGGEVSPVEVGGGSHAPLGLSEGDAQQRRELDFLHALHGQVETVIERAQDMAWTGMSAPAQHLVDTCCTWLIDLSHELGSQVSASTSAGQGGGAILPPDLALQLCLAQASFFHHAFRLETMRASMLSRAPRVALLFSTLEGEIAALFRLLFARIVGAAASSRQPDREPPAPSPPPACKQGGRGGVPREWSKTPEQVCATVDTNLRLLEQLSCLPGSHPTRESEAPSGVKRSDQLELFRVLQRIALGLVRDPCDAPCLTRGEVQAALGRINAYDPEPSAPLPLGCRLYLVLAHRLRARPALQCLILQELIAHLTARLWPRDTTTPPASPCAVPRLGEALIHATSELLAPCPPPALQWVHAHMRDVLSVTPPTSDAGRRYTLRQLAVVLWNACARRTREGAGVDAKMLWQCVRAWERGSVTEEHAERGRCMRRQARRYQ